MVPQLITALTPPLALAMALEALVARRSGRQRTTRWQAANLALAAFNQFAGVGIRGAALLAFLALRRHAELASPGPVVSFLVALIAVDFVNYWRHRASHRVSLLWSVHGIHHQSPEFGFAAATRAHVLAEAVRLSAFLPLAIFVDPWWILLADQISEIVDFFLHNEEVGKLGALEWVLNTPSHHRVHHGSNERYLDKNYGSMLIVWDRLFGTWEPETEPVRYGTATPLLTGDPVEAYLSLLRPIGVAMRGEGGPMRWLAPFRVPETLPHVPSVAPGAAGDARHAVARLAVTVGAGAVVLSIAESLPTPVFVLAAALVSAHVVAVARQFERPATRRTSLDPDGAGACSRRSPVVGRT